MSNLPISGALADILDSLGQVFGINIPKFAGETDIFKWTQVIRDNLKNLPATASSILNRISSRLDALQMTPIVGRLKTIVTEARRELADQKKAVQASLARAELAEQNANALASDLANSSAGDIVRGIHAEKKQQFNNAVIEARKAYEDIAALDTDIRKEK